VALAKAFEPKTIADALKFRDESVDHVDMGSANHC
jgi:hypothetical protein